MQSMTVGFIGSGQMATALGRGFVQAGLVAPAAVIAGDPHPAARKSFANALPGSRVVDNNRQVATQADPLILAVKPALVEVAVAEIRDALRPEALVVSIAAGVTLSQLATYLPAATRCVRVMPNTPVCLGVGATAYSLGATATPADGELVAQLFSAVGMAVQVPEKQLDAVTGLSGSGPAFVYTVIEALSDGAVLMGLPRAVATELAAQTVAGAARMVQCSNEHPAKLRDQVTSPGGTTIAGLDALERGGLRATLIDAVRAATERCVALRTEAEENPGS